MHRLGISRDFDVYVLAVARMMRGLNRIIAGYFCGGQKIGEWKPENSRLKESHNKYIM